MKKIFNLCFILACSLCLSACTKKDNSSTQLSSETIPPAQEMSLNDLIDKNISQKCTWTQQIDNTETSGEILIKGNKFRQLINIKGDNGDMTVNTVSDGEYIYFWSESPTLGNFAMKTKIDSSSDSVGDATTGEVDFNQKYKFSCNDTNIADAEFELPAGIEFSDYSEFLDQIKSSQ